MKKKAIIVAFHMGRVGSSALMGLLGLSGINLGNDKRLSSPSPMNPKGFFELESQQEFLVRIYAGIYPGITNPPSLALMDKIGREHYSEYNKLILSEFRNNYPIAIKSQRFLTLPFLFYLRSNYDIKVLVLERKLVDQVNSIYRVWQKYGNPVQKNTSKKFIVDYIEKWKIFSLQVERHFELPLLSVSFEQLISQQSHTTDRIFSFIGESPPSVYRVSSWLDKALVNRQEIT